MRGLISDDDSEIKRPQNPRKNANIFEIFTYSWLFNLFKIGKNKDLNVNDLYEPLEDFSSSLLGNELEKTWKSEMTNAFNVNRNPSLLRALIRMFGVKYFSYGLLLCINELTFKILQPILIGELLMCFNPINSNSTNSGYAFICASGLLLSMFISIIILRSTTTEILHCGLKMRIACCSIIFKKVLYLSHTSLGKIRIGQIINLVSNDVNKFDTSLYLTHYTWIGPLQAILVTYLLWAEIGIYSLLGVGTFFLLIPFQVWLGKKIPKQYSNIIYKTDERIRLMNEIISGIQLIKMYTWEKSFAKLIDFARNKEIQQIKKLLYIKMIIMIFKEIQSKFQLFIIIIVYVLFGNNLSVQKVYVIISFYNLLSSSMSSWFVVGMTGVAELKVTIKRIQDLLLLEEKDSLMSFFLKSHQEESTNIKELNNYKNSAKEEETDQLNDFSICIFNATAKWTHAQTSNSLENINLTVESGELVIIIGPIGAGKSSLIQLILRELPLLKGRVSVHGVLSYASQEPWLFAGSIRQNILFDSQMNLERYKQVIEVCALKSDFEKFPLGDRTIVGERGVMLSGGQKARINLARAVYKEADIYLLDDPLSAVDAHVGKYLFEKCIKSYLKKKTCLLVTHQLHYLTDVDQIVLLENANISAKGTYQELQVSEFDFAKLLESSEETSNECDNKTIIKNSISSNTHSQSGSHHSISTNVESKQNGVMIVPKEKEEKYSSVYIPKGVYISYFSASGNICRIVLLFCLFVFTQFMIIGGDYWLSFWVNQEEYNFQSMNSVSSENVTLIARDSSNFFIQSTNICYTCILVYSILMIIMIVSIYIRAVLSVSVCLRASTNLHNNVFNSIIRGTLRFFDLSSSGQIFNCFSNDIGAIDNSVPLVMCDSIQVILRVLVILFVVSLVNTYLIVPTLIIGFICCFLRDFFMPTFRSLRRLDSITRSPVFAHINESLRGLKTIRAFQVEQILSKEFDKHQDLQSSAYYLLLSSNQSISLWLDMVCFIYFGIVIFSFLAIDNNSYGGFIGLAITQSMRMVLSVQWAVRQSAILEIQMHSVEKVLEYMKIPQEAIIQSPLDKAPPKEWPESGDIVFQNFNLRYSPELPHTLKNLNFKIQSMEKVGIVGRTGAGKSSVINALFRLGINEGSIMIDGREIHDLGLHDLRSKLSVIPQEPILFSGTIRTNLDPFGEYPDHILWNALDEVELKVVVENSLGGLNSKMSVSGSNFSVGQRQLFCLARAIIRNNKILILDEATANVDPQTDALIQITIRNKFQRCTVLTIAHRLNTIMDSDKVLVMDAGSIVEFDHPYNLLKNKNGYFYKMVEKTGQASADLLKSVAAKSFTIMQMKRKSPIKVIDDNEDIILKQY